MYWNNTILTTTKLYHKLISLVLSRYAKHRSKGLVESKVYSTIYWVYYKWYTWQADACRRPLGYVRRNLRLRQSEQTEGTYSVDYKA